MCIFHRSSLSDGSSNNNQTATNRNRLTLPRAGSFNSFYFPISSSSSSQSLKPSPSQSHIHTIIPHTETPTTTIQTSTALENRTTTAVPHVQIVSLKPVKSNSLRDHFYYTQNENYKSNISSTLIAKNSSSNSLSHSSSPVRSFIFPKVETELKFEPRYDQSTLKSFFMNTHSSATTEATMTSNARDYEMRRQKILSFIISENQPSSFKAPSTTSTSPLITRNTTQKSFTNHDINKSSSSPPSSSFTNNNNNNSNKFNNAFVNTLESTSTTLKTTKLLSSRDQISFNNKPIRLTLSTVDDRNYSRKANLELPERKSLHLKAIEPTTYSPLKPYRVSTEKSESAESLHSRRLSSALLDIEKKDEIESAEIHSRRRPYVNDYLSSTAQIPTSEATSTTTPATTSSTQKFIAQSFTSRGLIFKEILNKTLEPQSHLKPIVSPYVSLETQRLTNAIRTTTPRTTNLVISRVTTSTSPRSYFYITASPKTTPLTSTTHSREEKIKVESTSTTTQLTFNNNEQTSSTTEHNRGNYRPYFTSSAITTYSPRNRFNIRTNSITSESPAVRRKVIRLKSGLAPPKNSPRASSSERIDITTYTPSKKVFIDSNFVSSPTSDTIFSKLNDFIKKLSKSEDLFSDTSTDVGSSNDLSNDSVESRSASVVELTEKPSSFYYTKYKFNINNFTDLHEISTKKFRETKISHDEEEKDELPQRYKIYSTTPSSTSVSSTVTQMTSTTKPFSASSTTTTTTTTEKSFELSTENPKSLIPPRATRVNNQLKSSILSSGLPPLRNSNSNSDSIKCNDDVSSNTKCNEIPSRY